MNLIISQRFIILFSKAIGFDYCSHGKLRQHESNTNGRKILESANDENEYIYCKHDGFDIVTHPMTLAFHETRMPWENILQEAIDMGYIVWTQHGFRN